MQPQFTYIDLNAELNLYSPEGKLQLHKDKEAASAYFNEVVNVHTRFFHDLEEKVKYLTENTFWDGATLEPYGFPFIKKAMQHAYGYKFRFPTFMSAYKFYSNYALRSDDGKTILERYEDRVVMTALHLAQGDKKLALSLIDEIITGRYQPATPTFQNAGKARGGEMVSCFLMRADDSLDSIADTWKWAAQLSKIGGGVAVNITSLRERGAPLKGKDGLAKGVISWMKIYEDIFSNVDQLGTRPGAGAVYLSAHHPDIMEFLDCKRENADEKIRIKTLSTGVVIPDVTFELARSGSDMYLFSPYDVKRVYGIPMDEVNITQEYTAMVNNPEIRKTKISARKFLQTLAELQFESGYPYILFADNANKGNPVDGVISMSNLCSEILQTNTPTIYDEVTGEIQQPGRDISCNLGSMNVVKAMASEDFGRSVDIAMRALTAVADMTSIHRVPTIKRANDEMHSVGLGQMSLASYFATHDMLYGDEDSLEFTRVYFALVNYHSLVSSSKIAQERKGTFAGFEKSTYATGEYWEQYLVPGAFTPQRKKVAKLFREAGIEVPSVEDWAALRDRVQKHGLWHAWRQAVAPTGSISYLANSSPSILPIVNKIEIRKEGKLGRVMVPAPGMNDENMHLYRDAYDLGPEAIIDVYAEASKSVDQGLSCTLHFQEAVKTVDENGVEVLTKTTTRDLTKAQLYAWRKGLKTLYYVRLRATNAGALSGLEVEGCVSCEL